MTQYRKKSLITAYQWNPEGKDLYFEDSAWEVFGVLPHNGISDYNSRGRINTKQGWQDVNVGDWLIHNPDGEVYPCNDKTFRDTYEAVEE